MSWSALHCARVEAHDWLAASGRLRVVARSSESKRDRDGEMESERHKQIGNINFIARLLGWHFAASLAASLIWLGQNCADGKVEMFGVLKRREKKWRKVGLSGG